MWNLFWTVISSVVPISVIPNVSGNLSFLALLHLDTFLPGEVPTGPCLPLQELKVDRRPSLTIGNKDTGPAECSCGAGGGPRARSCTSLLGHELCPRSLASVGLCHLQHLFFYQIILSYSIASPQIPLLLKLARIRFCYFHPKLSTDKVHWVLNNITEQRNCTFFADE